MVLAKDDGNDVGAPSTTRARADALLARYGGAQGPTGHASAGTSGSPVSLSTFIGGKSNAPRLGRLSGDGRTSGSEALAADPVAWKKLPGLAKDGSMASFLQQRERERGGGDGGSETPMGGGPDDVTKEAGEGDKEGKGGLANATGGARGDNARSGDSLHQRGDSSAPEESDASSSLGRNACIHNGCSPPPHSETAPPRSNLQAIIDATCGTAPAIPDATIVRVISNRMNAYGLQRAKNAEPPIPTSVLSLKTFQNRNPGKTREDYDLVLAERVLGDDQLDLVVLAGFMHVVSETFLSALGHETSLKTQPAFAKRPARALPIINLHPALPGAFDGANAIGRAYDAFQCGDTAHTGIMVHEVVAEVDRGAPIVVEEVPIREGECLDTLEERMHAVEHRLIKARPQLSSSTAAPLPAATRAHRILSSGMLEPVAGPLNPHALDRIITCSPSYRMLWVAHASAEAPLPQHARDVLGKDYTITPRLFTVRSDAERLYVDEVEARMHALCSAWSAVAVTDDGVLVWHGLGSDAAQRACAEEVAHTLAGREAAPRFVEEADTSHLWRTHFRDEEYASGWHHRLRATLPRTARDAQMYAPADAEHAQPFVLPDVRMDAVSIVDTRLEIFVLIGTAVRGDRRRITAALDRAEELAGRGQSALGGPVAMRPPVHVLVFPSVLPADLTAAAQRARDCAPACAADKIGYAAL
ncbi:phosphoribosylglycinamide formyltransferase 1 [Malassezia sp. CBS 17886]|nr:phosphoribosylglycinamide formyltransferase 1 [Malassezia sp. CBS 17886]